MLIFTCKQSSNQSQFIPSGLAHHPGKPSAVAWSLSAAAGLYRRSLSAVGLCSCVGALVVTTSCGLYRTASVVVIYGLCVGALVLASAATFGLNGSNSAGIG